MQIASFEQMHADRHIPSPRRVITCILVCASRAGAPKPQGFSIPRESTVPEAAVEDPLGRFPQGHVRMLQQWFLMRIGASSSPPMGCLSPEQRSHAALARVQPFPMEGLALHVLPSTELIPTVGMPKTLVTL